MARRRIKTLAAEWGVPVEEALAGCVRLKLGHAPSESSLLAPEEAVRLKADLDAQAHRAELLRRETVLETSAGKIVEKRLNATVMRRRHAEGAAPAAAPAAPFQFEDESEASEPFAAPFLNEPEAAPEIPEIAAAPPPAVESAAEAAPAEPIAPEPMAAPELIVEEPPPVVPEPSIEAKYADAAAMAAAELEARREAR
ncbi:MAG: hypothetical protein ACREQI_07860, partial [Candidatus Binataceae bacterium]